MSANATALPTDSDLLTTAETARYLRLGVSTLERMRLDASGPRFLKLGAGKRARVVYRRADLLAWLSAQEFKSTAEYGAPSKGAR
jgi:TfoX/Sxy family transcriptional regulator of competence genes